MDTLERSWLDCSRGYINNDLQSIGESFLKLGAHLKEVRDNKYYELGGYKNVFDFALDEFNLSKSSVSRFINIHIAFSENHNSFHIAQKYKEYNYSQLCEMLSCADDLLAEIKPNMSVKDIRELKKGISLPVLDVVDSLPGQIEINEYLDQVDSVATSEQKVEYSVIICNHDSKFPCSILGARDVAKSLDIDCPGNCCWNCDLNCGARCNSSAHNKSEIKLPYLEQRRVDLFTLYHCTRREFDKFDCLPEPGKKKKFKFGDYEMTIELKGDIV